ncbi:MAG: hypothetical protein OH354_02225 [Candidatus Parvarchaeota archaeon]|nr:hypothetical protein [Candidatus Jingweiarchaeum tengchongense]MCW1310239.1 hypothetical protein [Candidatus Jingweiarchaeum tengchongense]
MVSKKNNIQINEELVSRFSGLIHQYYDRFLADDSLSNVDVLLLSLYIIEQRNNKAGTTYNELKELFLSLGRNENNFNVALHRSKKQNLIEKKENLLFFLIRGLKQVWKILGLTGKSRVYIFKSGEFFTAIRLFEEFLQKEMKKDEILLFDPYISSQTIHPFLILKGRLKYLKILTSNVYDMEKFNDYKKKFENETGIKIEIRKNLKIHDRWLICGDRCWSIGSSIKDLGNKDTLIKELDGVTNSLVDLFQLRWNESSPF